jgi:ribosomal 50S subunit-recycling heat shock protein
MRTCVAEGLLFPGKRVRPGRAAGILAAVSPRKGAVMRLDKYLKVSRIIKRRTVANEACDSGRVMLNDKVARASAEVKVGDVIEVAFGTKAVKVRVTSVQETIRKEDTKEMFEYI